MSILQGISNYYSDVIEGSDTENISADGYVIFELAGILVTAALKFIIMDWLNMVAFYVTGTSFFWIAYIIYRAVRDPEITDMWGFRKEGFSQTLIFLLPFIVMVIAASLILGEVNTSVNILNWRFIPVLFLYPLWGLFQQYIMLVLIAGNLTGLEKVSLKRYQVILVTSLLFSLIHYPSLILMAFTFVMELIFLLAWFRWRNLLALGLSHGVIATFLLFYILERDLWIELFEWF